MPLMQGLLTKENVGEELWGGVGAFYLARKELDKGQKVLLDGLPIGETFDWVERVSGMMDLTPLADDRPAGVGPGRVRLHRPGGRRWPGVHIGGCHRHGGRRGQRPGLRRL